MVSQTSLITIIIPVYNARPFLRKAIESAIYQTYSNIEIIIIDDGSDDGSVEIINYYAQKDKRIVVVHQENLGLSAARNVGLDKMSGDVVAFLDFIQEMLYFLIQKDADIVICGYIDSNLPSNKGSIIRNPKMRGLYNRDEILRGLVDDSIGISVWNKIYRRELWDNIRFPEGYVYEDISTMFRLVNACKNVYLLNQPLYLYNMQPSSITHTYSWKNINDKSKNQKIIFEKK